MRTEQGDVEPFVVTAWVIGAEGYPLLSNHCLGANRILICLDAASRIAHCQALTHYHLRCGSRHTLASLLR